MGSWISFDKDHESVAKVKQYCESVVFVQFYGQTNDLKGSTDNITGKPKSELGHLLSELDKEVRKASRIEELEITKSMKNILRKMAEIRVCMADCETVEDCHQKLLNDAERFQAIYRKRGHESEVLEENHSFYWGTRQQLLFGKVICDWLATQDSEKASMDPIFGTLLNPTGGRVGPGDTGFFHDSLFDDMGPFAYHSAVHDGFGYLITNHKTGPGYAYLNKGLFGDWSPFGGQLYGIKYWEKICEKYHPDRATLEQFIFL